MRLCLPLVPLALVSLLAVPTLAFNLIAIANRSLRPTRHHDMCRYPTSSSLCAAAPEMPITSAAETATESVSNVTTPTGPSTRYTINMSVHPDVESVALKHADRDNIRRFLEQHPVSEHTTAAYSRAVRFVREFYQQREVQEQEQQQQREKREQKIEEKSRKMGEQGHGEMQAQFDQHYGKSGKEVDPSSSTGSKNTRPRPRHNVILDSGCGTGRSSVWLARSFPHLPVIGVDRSAVRLSKGRKGRNARQPSRREEIERSRSDMKDRNSPLRDSSAGQDPDGHEKCDGSRNTKRLQQSAGSNHCDNINEEPAENDGHDSGNGNGLEMDDSTARERENARATSNGSRGAHRNEHPQQRDLLFQNDGADSTSSLPTNLLLLRADLVDFWILAARDDTWRVEQHAILYPNPYPKRAQLLRRWHGHPVFPLIIGLGGRISLRSNWKAYLEEVCQAVLAISDAGARGKVKGGEEVSKCRREGTIMAPANACASTAVPEKGHHRRLVSSEQHSSGETGEKARSTTTDVIIAGGVGAAGMKSGSFAEGSEESSGGDGSRDNTDHHDPYDIAAPGRRRRKHQEDEAAVLQEARKGGSKKGIAPGQQAAADCGDQASQHQQHRYDEGRGVGPVPLAVAAAATAYSESARKGPVAYSPTECVTNFEEKYLAVGEAIYELVLEPRT
ncbi:unnamed protein product, partial [Sphacelaria rigidula]